MEVFGTLHLTVQYIGFRFDLCPIFSSLGDMEFLYKKCQKRFEKHWVKRNGMDINLLCPVLDLVCWLHVKNTELLM